MYDIIIIGGGTAGLSASIYSLRAGKSVLILESKVHGGQIINSFDVENYPGIKKINGVDFANNLLDQAKSLGLEIKYEKVEKIEDNKVITVNNSFLFKTLIIATGAKNRLLKLDNEQNLIGKGISYCAYCDGSFYKDKIVAVNGGGNTALEDALYLSNYSKKVYLIHRKEKFKAEKNLIDKINKLDNIEIIFNSNIIKIIGNKKLEEIIIYNGREEKKLKIDGLFVAIGRDPETEIFKDLVELNKSGYIISNEDCKTKIKNIFVAGDCRTKKVRQLVTAAADGAIASIMASEYLDKD